MLFFSLKLINLRTKYIIKFSSFSLYHACITCRMEQNYTYQVILQTHTCPVWALDILRLKFSQFRLILGHLDLIINEWEFHCRSENKVATNNINLLTEICTSLTPRLVKRHWASWGTKPFAISPLSASFTIFWSFKAYKEEAFSWSTNLLRLNVKHYYPVKTDKKEIYQTN